MLKLIKSADTFSSSYIIKNIPYKYKLYNYVFYLYVDYTKCGIIYIQDIALPFDFMLSVKNYGIFMKLNEHISGKIMWLRTKNAHEGRRPILIICLPILHSTYWLERGIS